MTATSPIPQVTGPVPSRRSVAPVLPVRRRRGLTFAALTRRGRRRASWIRADHVGVLPPVAMVTTVVGALVLTLMLGGWVVL